MGSSLINYEQQVRPWRQATSRDPSKRAAALILRMGTVAHQVCSAAGSDIVANNDGVDRILAILRAYFAPEAVESGNQEVVRSPQLKRTAQTVDVYLAEFDLLLRQAGSKMRKGGDRPESSESVLCIRNASLSGKGDSLVSASAQGGLGSSDVAKQMGRLFGTCSG